MRPQDQTGSGRTRYAAGTNHKPLRSRSIWSMFGQMLKHVRKQWGRLLIAFLSIILISLLQFVIPQITRWTIDSVIPGKQFDMLIWIGGSVLGAALLLGIFSYISSSFMAAVGQSAIFELRNDLYRHIQSLDLSFFDRNRTGDLMSRVTNDVNMLQQLISSSMMSIVTDSFTFIAIACYMLYIDWQLTILLLAVFPVMIYTTRLFGGRIRSSFRKVQESVADVSDHLQNSFTGIRLIKAFGTESHEQARFSERSARNRDANIRTVKLRATYEPLIDFLNYLGLAAVLVFGSWKAMQGDLTIGTVVAFMAYLRLLQNPVRHFSRILNTVQQSAAAYERIVDVMNTKPEVTEQADAILLPELRGHVLFKQVDFAYDEGKPVLQQFNLELEPGKVTALVGSSGSGKTTIAHLIARFYDVQAGHITIDGWPINDLALHSLRSHMGIVSQDIFLFNGSIRENIRYGSPGASEQQMLEAAQAANAHAFITSFEHGYDSEIGERGVKLSGGQKQRISIARAILKNPQLIILDEATASLDTESEFYIQDALARLLSGRTCLVIAHRLSTVQRADRIYVLEQGRIVESGTHDKLLRQEGRYRQLYELQFPQNITDKDSSLPNPS